MYVKLYLSSLYLYDKNIYLCCFYCIGQRLCSCKTCLLGKLMCRFSSFDFFLLLREYESTRVVSTSRRPTILFFIIKYVDTINQKNIQQIVLWYLIEIESWFKDTTLYMCKYTNYILDLISLLLLLS